MMADYDEFRVQLTPSIDPTQPGQWNVQLDCPIAGLNGPKGAIVPSFARAKLRRLRNRNGWPNQQELEAIGTEVWQNLMTAELAAAFEACRTFSEQQNKGLRLVISIVGGDDEEVQSDVVGMPELPIEAMFKSQLNFIATKSETPISRSLQTDPDRQPAEVSLPLRLLVVVSAPNDKPPSDAAQELQAIRTALGSLATPGGPIELEVCDPPTKNQLRNKLRHGFHILHFIGHGGFDIVGNDPTPRAHLCLEKPPTDPRAGETDPVDASTLSLMLQGSDVNLVILSACSSSAPTPNQEPYDHSAYAGIAQRLIAGISGVSAVVAMQFDMESAAAVNFSRAFYTNFFVARRKLDEAVTEARRTLATDLNPGHRAWVTPSVYSRCVDAQVFQIHEALGTLKPASRQEVQQLTASLEIYRKNVKELAAAGNSPELVEMRNRWLQEVAQMTDRRSELFGETVRLHGGTVAKGATIACRLCLRQQLAGRIGRVKVRCKFPQDKLDFVNCESGSNAQHATPMTSTPNPDEVLVLVDAASQQQEWGAGNYEICRVNFKVSDNCPVGFVDIKTTVEEVLRNGNADRFNPIDAALFVEPT